MSVANDLQTVISRVGLAVAGGETYRRVDLERLARELSAIREEASKERREAVTTQALLGDLLDGVDDRSTALRTMVRQYRAKANAIRTIADEFVPVPDLGTAQ